MQLVDNLHTTNVVIASVYLELRVDFCGVYVVPMYVVTRGSAVCDHIVDWQVQSSAQV